jgi:hypothetical protein
VDSLFTPDRFSFVLRFLVPGFVILYARNQFLSNRPPPFAEAAVTYIALSFVYQALVFWVPFESHSVSLPTGGAALVWVLLLFLGPAIVGVALGFNARRGWTRSLLSRIGVTVSHPVDTAWDWRFGECEACWVLVVLKDGTQWAGYLGDHSFLSTDRDERDLYLESVYSIDRRNRWTPKGSSVWIAHGEVQSLEFWPLKAAEGGIVG